MSNPAGTRKKIEAIDSMLFVGAEDIAKLDRTIAALTAERDALKVELVLLEQELAETLDRLIGIEEWYDGAAEDKYISRRNELVTAGYESEANNANPTDD